MKPQSRFTSLLIIILTIVMALVSMPSVHAEAPAPHSITILPSPLALYNQMGL